MRRRLRRAAILLIGLGVLGALSACQVFTEVPLVTDPKVITNQTHEEQLMWVEEVADATITVSGVPDGWYWLGGEHREFAWTGDTADREPIRGSLAPGGCGTVGAGSVYLGIKNFETRSDFLAIAALVRTYWESEGWVVTDVTPPTDHEEDFRADREDGALLGFTASEERLLIEIYTSCSAHDTVVNWAQHRGISNPFQDELDRREQSGETG